MRILRRIFGWIAYYILLGWAMLAGKIAEWSKSGFWEGLAEGLALLATYILNTSRTIRNGVRALERTAFILEYLRDETLRRRVRIALNRGESLHSLARALFFGQLGQFHERQLEDQMHRASCLLLLIAAISTWNAVYLQQALPAMQAAGVSLDEEQLRHTFPLGWNHINFFGKYDFDLKHAYSLQSLRPLQPKPTLDLQAA